MNDQFSNRELMVLLRELGKILAGGVAGEVVELGCYKGDTSVEIARVLERAQKNRSLYVYDSFVGLPYKAPQDQSPAGEQFTAGELPATKKDVITRFKKSGLRQPIIKKAWFHELAAKDLPEQICLAFMDGDFYDSIMCSLKLVWPKLAPGSVVIVDDYQNEALPGAARAVDEWLKTHPARLQAEASLAIIRPA
ncbi:hypothetical protein BH10PAT3_BH10PAT3_6120 [soil metagenome]